MFSASDAVIIARIVNRSFVCDVYDRDYCDSAGVGCIFLLGGVKLNTIIHRAISHARQKRHYKAQYRQASHLNRKSKHSTFDPEHHHEGGLVLNM